MSLELKHEEIMKLKDAYIEAIVRELEEGTTEDNPLKVDIMQVNMLANIAGFLYAMNEINRRQLAILARLEERGL